MIIEHSRYLYSDLVVMALGTDKVTGDKKAIAEAVIAVKEEFDVKKVNVNKEYSKFDVLKVWPEGESRPSLAKFDLFDFLTS